MLTSEKHPVDYQYTPTVLQEKQHNIGQNGFMLF